MIEVKPDFKGRSPDYCQGYFQGNKDLKESIKKCEKVRIGARGARDIEFYLVPCDEVD